MLEFLSGPGCAGKGRLEGLGRILVGGEMVGGFGLRFDVLLGLLESKWSLALRFLRLFDRRGCSLGMLTFVGRFFD